MESHSLGGCDVQQSVVCPSGQYSINWSWRASRAGAAATQATKVQIVAIENFMFALVVLVMAKSCSDVDVEAERNE